MFLEVCVFHLPCLLAPSEKNKRDSRSSIFGVRSEWKQVLNMPTTHGHANPRWTRDETILALDLYMRNRTKVPGKKASEVIELSKLMAALPYHDRKERTDNFRNPDGVAMKLQNLRFLDTGEGLTGASSMDKSVWEEFKDRQSELQEIAGAIRIAAQSLGVNAPAEEEFELVFREGNILFQMHRRRERASGLKSAFMEVLSRRRESPKCCACGLLPVGSLGEEGLAAFEVHHIHGLARGGERETRLEDLALLCACCHRVLHRLSSTSGRWILPSDLAALLA